MFKVSPLSLTACTQCTAMFKNILNTIGCSIIVVVHFLTDTVCEQKSMMVYNTFVNLSFFVSICSL